jgi:hypothetical protein
MLLLLLREGGVPALAWSSTRGSRLGVMVAGRWGRVGCGELRVEDCSLAGALCVPSIRLSWWGMSMSIISMFLGRAAWFLGGAWVDECGDSDG